MPTESFTASNGLTLSLGPTSIGAADACFGIVLDFPSGKLVSDDDFLQAMQEWMQHRRDIELGRWRDPAAPHRVVYPKGRPHPEYRRYVRVVDELTGLQREWTDNDAVECPTARAWFAAHPEQRPWEDAKAGSFWNLTPTSSTALHAIAHGDGTFTDHNGASWQAVEILDAIQLNPGQVAATCHDSDDQTGKNTLTGESQ